MRHYFGYDIEGRLRSVESYGPSGWPLNQCMEDPQCFEKAVTSLRETRAAKSPEIINWVLFDCPCDPGQGTLLRDCPCTGVKFSESYVDVATKTMRPKPMRSLYIDDVLVENMSVITKEPGTTVVLKVTSEAMPDGAKITCTQKGLVDIIVEDTWELTFTAGRTDTKTLTAPAQGTKGFVFISGTLLRPISFGLRGFVAP